MTFTQIRNKIISLLWDYLERPVVLADQVEPELEFPYGIYTVTTPYVPHIEQGDITTADAGEGAVTITRMEMPSATLSFTFCSQNRTGDQGEAISGEDEAAELADRAIGFFLHAGYDDFSRLGITIVDVGQAQNRSTLVIDEAARRVGFDVRIRYTRQDTRKVSTIETAPIIEKE